VSKGREQDHGGVFRKGDPRTIELARKGGRVKAERDRAGREPYPGTVVDLMGLAGLEGPSWAPWRAFLKAVHALPMDETERAIFTRHTEREEPPADPVDEGWMVVGRRGGKSRIASLVAVHRAISFDSSRLAPGELALVLVLAADRSQARVEFGYAKGLCEMEELRPYVHRVLRDRIEFHSGVNLEIGTASFRTTRGYTIIAAILDEIAFWYLEADAANPDSEILTALRPGMATVPDSLLLGLSSPYAQRGELYRAVERSFGHDDPHALVWNADSRSMHPDLPAHVVERAFEDDPVAAASEFGQDGRVVFRQDVQAFLDPMVVRDVTSDGVREIPPASGRAYLAFVDPSGGSQDSFTLAIAHSEGGRAVLDLVREVRPPFSPDEVVAEFVKDLGRYGVTEVTGDRYGGEWPRERFQRHGIRYLPSDLTKSDIYKEFLPLANAGQVALLDLPVLRAQLVGLERRVSRGGKDSIDHPRGGRDDVANAAAGAVVLAAPAVRKGRTFKWSVGPRVDSPEFTRMGRLFGSGPGSSVTVKGW